jgi:hypothetical protein
VKDQKVLDFKATPGWGIEQGRDRAQRYGELWKAWIRRAVLLASRLRSRVMSEA